MNATTVSYLLSALGMSDISPARQLTVANAVRRVNETKHKTVKMLKRDPFFADANWELVEKRTIFYDLYSFEDDNVEVLSRS